jgi:hypothetical protein
VVLRAEQPAQAAVHLDDHLAFEMVNLAVDGEPYDCARLPHPQSVRARLVEPSLPSEY